MKWNGNTGLALLLIASGLLILLSKLTGGGWNVMEWLMPAAMVGLGFYGIQSGRKKIGWIVMTVGLFFLACKLWGIVAFLLPFALVWLGWTLLKRRGAYD